MQALCDFCSDKILPLLERPITKDQYLAIAKKSNLEDYFEQRRSKYGWDEMLVSPYRVQSRGTTIPPETKLSRQCKSAWKGTTLSCCHTISSVLKAKYGDKSRGD
jgi:hypothetical protein